MKRFLIALAALLIGSTGALAADTLTIYTYESFVAEWGPGPKITPLF